MFMPRPTKDAPKKKTDTRPLPPIEPEPLPKDGDEGESPEDRE
jgi:hypothetical protein